MPPCSRNLESVIAYNQSRWKVQIIPKINILFNGMMSEIDHFFFDVLFLINTGVRGS